MTSSRSNSIASLVRSSVYSDWPRSRCAERRSGGRMSLKRADGNGHISGVEVPPAKKVDELLTGGPHEAAGIHHARWWRSGGVAACRARTADGDAGGWLDQPP